MQNFHRLFLASQQLNDRLSSVSSTDGRGASLSTSKQDSDFDNDDFDEKYNKMFPVEAVVNTTSISSSFGSEIVGSSEQDLPASDSAKLSTKYGSLERSKRNSRDLSPLPVRRKVEYTSDEGTDKDDVFVKPRPPGAPRKGARRPLPLDYAHGKEDKKGEERSDLKRIQSWLVLIFI